MFRTKATRITVFISSLAAAFAMPAIASAHCGATQGSFALSCEQGVKVFRHNAPSAIPQGLTPAQARLEAAKLSQQTALARMAATQRAQAQTNALRQRELDLEDYNLRILDRNTRRRTIVYGSGFNTFGLNNGGFTVARPLRVGKQN